MIKFKIKTIVHKEIQIMYLEFYSILGTNKFNSRDKSHFFVFQNLEIGLILNGF